MLKPNVIYQQVEAVTTDFIRCSLCNHQNFPSIVSRGQYVDVGVQFFGSLSIVLKNVHYDEIYDALLAMNAYNLRMLDGALIQMMYRFNGEKLESHRLAFYPSPYLHEYQNEPEIYKDDPLYADVLKKNILPVAVRYDYDTRDEVFQVVEHPKSHLTLGQYENCRIPVSAPLTPFWFCDFILRNFYNTAYSNFSEQITNHADMFNHTIFHEERQLLHISLPN